MVVKQKVQQNNYRDWGDIIVVKKSGLSLVLMRRIRFVRVVGAPARKRGIRVMGMFPSIMMT